MLKHKNSIVSFLLGTVTAQRAAIMFAATTMLLLGSMSPLFGATIDWTTWASQPSDTSAVGIITAGTQTVTVIYSGEIAFTQLNGTGTNYYLPLSTFTADPTVGNAPASDMIAINGTDTTHTITFGTAVLNPVLEVVSLGTPMAGTQYDFSLSKGQSMSILAQGPSDVYGGCSGTCLSVSGSTLTGTEGDGLIQFTGTFTSLTWTGANPEFWNGFTIGVAGVAAPMTAAPEPATWVSMLMAALFAVARSGRKLFAGKGAA